MGEYLLDGQTVAKFCALHGDALVVKRSKHQRHQYLACPRPGCAYNLPIPEDIRQHERNAARLPGF